MKGRKSLRRAGIVLGFGALLCAGMLASGALGMVSAVSSGGTDSTSTATDATTAATDSTSSTSTSADTTGSTTTDATPPPTTTDTTSSTTTTTSPFLPSITSDQPDYVPGATVTLTGANWGAGVVVHINVNDDQGQSWVRNVDVTTDATGNITDSFNLPDWFIATYTVRATAGGAAATTTFTDGNVNVRTVGTTSGTAADVAWVRFTNADCTGALVVVGGASSGTISAATGGNGNPIPGGVDSPNSLRLTAQAVSGFSFANWTGDISTTPPDTSNPICVAGRNNPTRQIQVNYTAVPTFNVTFAQSGIGSDTGSNTVLTVGSNTYTASQLPVTLNFASGSSVAYAYSTPVSSTTAGKRYVNTSTTGPASPITVTANTTVTGNYTTQYRVTFAATGLTADATGTVLTVGGSDTIPVSDLGTAAAERWFNAGSNVSYSYEQVVGSSVSGKRYNRSSGPTPASPINGIGAPASVTAGYTQQFQLTLATIPLAVGTSNINGASNGDWFDNGTTATVTAQQDVTIGTGSRYHFSAWSGGSTATTLSTSVTMSAPRSLTANYSTQYLLTLATSPASLGASHISGGVSGNWYDDGTVLSLSADGTVAGPSAGSRYDFRNWTGDVAGSPNSSNPVGVTMNQARSITANYQLQFQLTLATSPASLGASHISGGTSGNWYDDGTVLSLNPDDTVAGPSAGSRYRFDHWTGDFPAGHASDDPLSLTMNAAKSLTAAYQLQYQLTFAQTGIGTDTGTNTIVTVNGSAKAKSALPFNDWFDVGTTVTYAYSTPIFTSPVTSKQYELSSVSPPTTSPITVSGAATITGNYTTSTFTIHYLQPLDEMTEVTVPSVVNTGKNGRVIPTKVELRKDGIRIDSSNTPGVVTIKVVGSNLCTGTATVDPVELYADAGSSNANTNLFRWDGSGFWIYNLDTTGLGLNTNGCYRLDVYIGTGIKASASTLALFKPTK
jgi:hypothetical protein